MFSAIDEKWALYLNLAESNDKLDEETIKVITKKSEGNTLSTGESQIFARFQLWADRLPLWDAYHDLIRRHEIKSSIEDIVVKVHQLEHISDNELTIFYEFEEWAAPKIAH